MRRSDATEGKVNAAGGRKPHTPTPLAPEESRWVGDLWVRYRVALVAHAARKLAQLHVDRAEYDAADAVSEAFRKVCKRATCQKLAAIHEDGSVLRFLFTTLNFVILDLRRGLAREKRGDPGPAGTRSDDALHGLLAPLAEHDRRRLGRRDTEWEEISSRCPPPEWKVIEEDRLEVLLERLGDPTLRTIACMRVEGSTRSEIAAALELAESTVECKLAAIRSVLVEIEIDER